YLLTDALIGTGLTVVLAHVARTIGGVRWRGRAVMAGGVSSYGLYPVPQPYVLYFAERMRGLETPMFVAAASGIIVVLALGAMALERAVNALTDRVLASGRRDPVAGSAYRHSFTQSSVSTETRYVAVGSPTGTSASGRPPGRPAPTPRRRGPRA